MQAPRQDARREQERGRRSRHSWDLEDLVDDVTEVVVVASDHPAEKIRGAGRHPRFNDFWDCPQVFVDRAPAALGDLEAHERRDGIPDLAQVDLGAEADDHAGLDQFVEMSLSGVAGNSGAPGERQDSRARRGGQRLQQAPIDLIQELGLSDPLSLIRYS